MHWQTVFYILYALVIIGAAYFIFRIVVRGDYNRKSHLTPLSSTLELLVFGAYMCFPYVFNPADWVNFWEHIEFPHQIIGLVLILLGMGIAFGTMVWFGIRRAFGQEVNRLVVSGPYRLTRNPQVVGGYPMVIGVAVQWPSWYALGWVILWGVITHMMILTEEEHLLNVFGEEYAQYCKQVPRYISLPM